MFRLKPIPDPAWLVLAVPLVAGSGLQWRPGQRLLGHALGEAPGHLWTQWLLERALGSGQDLFRHEGIQIGSQLWVYPVDLTNRLLSLVLGSFLGDVATFNCLALALVALAGLATVGLAREAGATPWPSLVAGTFVAFHPAYLGYVADGRLDSATLGWGILVAWAWLRLVREPGPRRALVLAGSVGLLAASSPNLTVVMAATLLLPTGVALYRLRGRLARPLALAVLASGVLVAPTLALLVQVEGASGARIAQASQAASSVFELVDRAELDAGVGDLWRGAAALDRGPVVQQWHTLPAVVGDLPSTRRAAQDLVVQSYGPGARRFLPWSPFVLVLFAPVTMRRRAWVCLGGAALLQVVALGDGLAQGLPFFLPGLSTGLIVRVKPVLGVVGPLRHFTAFGLFSSLGAVAMGVGVSLSLSRWRWRLRGVALALIALLFLELQLLGPTPLPLRVTEAVVSPDLVEALARQGGGGVLLLPKRSEVDRLLQVAHQQPADIRFNMESQHTQGRGRSLDLFKSELSRGPLSRQTRHDVLNLGVDTVLLVPGLLPPEERGDVLEHLRESLGPPVWRDEVSVVFDLRYR